MSLPPLDSVPTCVKCGWDVVGATMDYGVGGMMSYGDGKLTVHNEYLERTCRRCSYRWKESPLDAT